jgi:ATP-dependent RNA helicase RhlE
MLREPVTINLERKSAPATGITQAVYVVPQERKADLLLALLERDLIDEALVFTRTKHRANRLWEYLDKRRIPAARIHGNRSQPQRTEALEGFKSGRYRVLVATDIAARGIDVEALGHVVNFDVPTKPDDYIHRVGRTARAELTGEAFTFVAPAELGDLHAIERALGQPLLRVTVPDFDYSPKSAERVEIPLPQRQAGARVPRSSDRRRTREERERSRTAKQANDAQTRPAPETAKPQRSMRSHRRPGRRR